MSDRPRDNQRQRLYDAENAAHAKVSPTTYWKQSIPNDALQAYADAVFARGTFQRRWPGKKAPKVVLGRGGGWSSDWRNEIRLGVGARNEWVILHELAHQITPSRYAAHGPEFAGVYLWLVEDNLGKAAGAALREAYRDKKVRKSNAAVPAPISYEEQRLREAVTAARKAYREAEAALAAHRAANKGLAA